jgi:hypothetical protein
MRSYRTRLGQSTGMPLQKTSLTNRPVKALQKAGRLPNLCGNTPAMPLVASAAKHKLCGFFMPGTFWA